ncbi:MAG: rRNA pseudouridine synthase [Lachnospiraceae bacterium]|nr:rRNA pseudouridine synthase [Lachnospiraceae bacterium]
MSDLLYYMFNKPKGCITARKDMVHKTVMDYFEEELREEIFPVGRLDKDTTGLLLFTNDGQFDQYLMHPKHHVKKTYYFWVYGEINKEKLDALREGVNIGRGEEIISKPCEVEILKYGKYSEFKETMAEEGCEEVGHNSLLQMVGNGYITISEGKKHQVKRMFRAIGCYVVMLRRVAIGEVELDCKLKEGEYRKLTEEERERLYRDEV